MTPSDRQPAPVPEHVAELRRRWEEDPGSRLFLQLAEEYRRLGRHGEAVTVLESGIERHPGQVSAHVALGRARLHTDDAGGAVEALDRALELDPTNLVAHKLLVEAHLAQGDRDLARQRLDLYLLLNEGDPDADELRRRVGRGGGAAEGDATADASAPARADEREAGDGTGEGSAADLGWDPAWAAGEGGGVQGSPGAEPAGWAAGQIADEEGPEAEEPMGAAGQDAAAAATNGRGTPFGDLGGPRDRRRYLAALGAGGIFPLEVPAEAPSAAKEPAAPFTAPSPELPAAEPAALAAEPATAEPPVAAGGGEPEDERPTVTLGELYLRQGHPRQAERIFERVLAREADHAAAADGLERARAALASRPAAPAGSLTARQLLDEAEIDAPPRVALLHAYLARIRSGGRPARGGRT